jgi:hypothetical protein
MPLVLPRVPTVEDIPVPDQDLSLAAAFQGPEEKHQEKEEQEEWPAIGKVVASVLCDPYNQEEQLAYLRRLPFDPASLKQFLQQNLDPANLKDPDFLLALQRTVVGTAKQSAEIVAFNDRSTRLSPDPAERDAP